MITSYHDIHKLIQQADEPIHQITELDLSSIKIFIFTTKIKKCIQSCHQLVILKLCQCQLSSLTNLPDIDIVSLDLSLNKIKDDDLSHLTKYKHLTILNLSDNFICSLESIKQLKKCGELKDLCLEGNDVANGDQTNYRSFIFKELTGLQLLDKMDAEGQPPAEDNEHSYDDVSGQEEEEEEDEYTYQEIEVDSQNSDAAENLVIEASKKQKGHFLEQPENSENQDSLL